MRGVTLAFVVLTYIGVLLLVSEVSKIRKTLDEIKSAIDAIKQTKEERLTEEVRDADENAADEPFDMDWFLTKLAIIKVESNFKPHLENKNSKAGGLFQIMPADRAGFLSEANRITKGRFADSSRFDPKASVEIFETVHRRHNKGKDIERAIKLHNPTAGEWYRQRVLKEYDFFKTIAGK